MWRQMLKLNQPCHPKRSEGPAVFGMTKKQFLASLRMTTQSLQKRSLRTAASCRPVGQNERGTARGTGCELQLHTVSEATGSLQDTASMFFHNAATGAQRKRRRLVLAFGAEGRRIRGWLRREIGGRVVRQEVDQD